MEAWEAFAFCSAGWFGFPRMSPNILTKRKSTACTRVVLWPAPAALAEAGTAPRCLARLSGRAKGVLGLGQWVPAGLHQLPLKVTTAQETYPREHWGLALALSPLGRMGCPGPGWVLCPHGPQGILCHPTRVPSSGPSTHDPAAGKTCSQQLTTALCHWGVSGPRWRLCQ